MNWYWFFYLFSVADKLHSTFLTFSIILGIAFIVFFFIWLFTNKLDTSYSGDIVTRDKKDSMSSKDPKLYNKFMWWFRAIFISTLTFIFLTVVIPQKKEMLLILAGGAVGEFVTSNEDAKQLPADITKFLRHEIMADTEELKEDAKQEVKAALNIPDKLEDLSKEQLIEKLKELQKE